MPAPFEPRSYVNGAILKDFAGQMVSMILRVEDESGSSLTTTSTDNKKVRVQLPETLGARKGDWVEIIGLPAGAEAIRAKEAILFSGEQDDFDTEAYNAMVMFMTNCRDIYKSG